MYAFDYSSSQHVTGAVADLAKDDAKALAGGQTLMPTMKQRLASPAALIDLGSVAELSGIAREGDAIVIGAMTRHADVATSARREGRDPGARQRSPAASATPRCAIAARSAARSPTTTRPPTIPPRALALGATIVTNKREIAADDYLQRPVRDRARSGRAHHRRCASRSRRRRPTMKFRQPRLALCAGRRVRRQDRRRRPRRGHRRGRRAACSASSAFETALDANFSRRRARRRSRSRPTV